MSAFELPMGYAELLESLKQRIVRTRVRAAVAVTRELIGLYWEIGRSIVDRQEVAGWGQQIIERLARDLRVALPDARGFSARNLWRMRSFYLAWREPERLLPQVVAELPWGHNALLIERLDAPAERLWYAERCVEHGWSRNILAHQIDSRLYHRQGKALTNFAATLPAPDSELARQVLKDPYVFDFLDIGSGALERELEAALMRRMRDFLLELGMGFAFVGSQYRLEVGGEEFFVDLLFYHLHLRRYFVIELKAGPFRPEYAGKLNFYLTAVDEQVRNPAHDGQTIGLLLCREKNAVIVEYALRDVGRPIGVSAWQLTEALPDGLKDKLPSRDEFERLWPTEAEIRAMLPLAKVAFSHPDPDGDEG